MKDLLISIINGINRIPKDKLLHFIVGIFIYCFCYIILHTLLPLGKPIEIFSFIVVFILAILKETWIDKKIINGTVEVMDAIATILGGLLCFIMSFVF